MVFPLYDLLLALPEIILSVVVLLLVLAAAFGGQGAKNTRRVTRYALVGVTLALVIIWYGTNTGDVAFSGMYIADNFATYMKILVLLGVFFALLLSIKSLSNEDITKPEYPLLILMSLIGMMIMISANDLMSLYMAVELQSLPLYVVAAMRTNSLRSSEAGLKYFLLGALSSGMLLYGASLVYGFCNTTNFSEIAKILSDNELPAGFIVGMVFMVSGIAFKISAVPFHMWTPDVYEGSPSIVTALFAIVPKVAAVALMMRLTYGAFGTIAVEWSQILIILSVSSMIIGTLGAIIQSDIKRMMAYSSIAHMGYGLAGLATGTEQGAIGVIIYMTGYIFMGAGSFSMILLMRRDGQAATRIVDLQGLSGTHPMQALGFMIVMFSMAGIPPLAGFFGKWYVFFAAVDAGLVFLAIIGVVTSVASAFYYLRIVKIMYFEDADELLDEHVPLPNKFVMGLSVAVILMFFVGLGPLLEEAGIAAGALMANS